MYIKGVRVRVCDVYVCAGYYGSFRDFRSWYSNNLDLQKMRRVEQVRNGK